VSLLGEGRLCSTSFEFQLVLFAIAFLWCHGLDHLGGKQTTALAPKPNATDNVRVLKCNRDSLAIPRFCLHSAARAVFKTRFRPLRIRNHTMNVLAIS
jgi:hypothetical protein